MCNTFKMQKRRDHQKIPNYVLKNKVISGIHQQINLQKRYFAMYSTQNGKKKKKKKNHDNRIYS